MRFFFYEQILSHIDAGSKPHAVKSTRFGQDKTYDADYLTCHVEQRPAAVAGVDGCVHLNAVGVQKRVALARAVLIPEKDFHRFIEMLNERSDRVWIGTLGDILKYQAQYRSARLVRMGHHGDSISYQLNVGTDPSLYDHPLTMALQRADTEKILILQDGSPVKIKAGTDGMIFVDLVPKNSLIRIDGLSSVSLSLTGQAQAGYRRSF